MAYTFAELKAKVLSEVGQDATAVQVADSLNSKRREMAARSGWFVSTVTVATTTEGVGAYPLDAAIVDVPAIRVGGAEYARVGISDLWRLQEGGATADGPVFAPAFDATGTKQIELFPLPVGGLDITAPATIVPADMAADADTTGLPADMDEALVNGAAGQLISRLDERPDLAQYFDGQFETAVERLRRRSNSRVGSGPVQIQVKGFQW